ncbi:hypothetical protein EPO34_02625 [Patescibacteria group bacterium]|nr:MAG: hypothetical protein EPO34_02625 [Patescibacteria group bacterium]
MRPATERATLAFALCALSACVPTPSSGEGEGEGEGEGGTGGTGLALGVICISAGGDEICQNQDELIDPSISRSSGGGNVSLSIEFGDPFDGPLSAGSYVSGLYILGIPDDAEVPYEFFEIGNDAQWSVSCGALATNNHNNNPEDGHIYSYSSSSFEGDFHMTENGYDPFSGSLDGCPTVAPDLSVRFNLIP